MTTILIFFLEITELKFFQFVRFQFGVSQSSLKKTIFVIITKIFVELIKSCVLLIFRYKLKPLRFAVLRQYK